MTIQSTYAPVTYAGDGATTAFTIPWAYQYDTDIVAQITVVSSGVITLLALGTDYNVSPSSGAQTIQSGTLTLSELLAVGTTLTISRSPALDQVSIWTENFANPAKLSENAIDKLTMIAQGLQSQISAGGGGPGGANTVTTADFTAAAIGGSQTVQVKSVTGFNVNNYALVSDGTTTMYVQVTAISSSASTLTCKTISFVYGFALSVVKKGAAVQLSVVPTGNTINFQDGYSGTGTPSSVTSGTAYLGGTYADFNANSATATPVLLYLNNNALPTNALLSGYITGLQVNTIKWNGLRVFNGSVPVFQPAPAIGTHFITSLTDTIGNNLLQTDNGTNVLWGGLKAAHVPNGLLQPIMLAATNSPSAGQVPSFANNGQFTWVTAAGGALPGGGTSAVFLRGDSGGVWSSTLVGTNGITLQTGTGTNAKWNPQPLDGFGGTGKFASVPGVLGVFGNASAATDASMLNILGATLVLGQIGAGSVLGIDNDAGRGASNQQVEGVIAHNQIIRGKGLRTVHGPWRFIYTLPTLGAITLDPINGAYQRMASVTGAVTFTMADTTPAPTLAGWAFAHELMVEINAPGANTFTWPGTITWANGGSAPALNAGGINLIKLVRRQGQTQWVGSVANPTAGTSYSDGQAINALMSTSRFLTTGTITPTVVTGTSGTVAFNINALSVTNTMLAGSIAASKIANFPATGGVYLDGLGNWTAPSGGGGSFSTAQPHTWTATQTFSTGQTFQATNTFVGNNFGTVSANNAQVFNFAGLGVGSFDITTLGYTDGLTYFHGIDLNFQNNFSSTNPGASTPLTITHVYQNPSTGGGTSINLTQVNAAPTTAGNYHAAFNQENFCTKLAGGDSSALFIQSFGPNTHYSGTNDPFYPGVGHHSFTGGTIRIGEINYGNSWSDFGMSERRGLSNVCVGLEFFPQYFGGYPTYDQYDAQWAIAIGNAGQVSNGNSRNSCNYIGILIDQDSISPGGYGLKLWGARQNPFNGTTPTANAPASMIKIAGTMHVGIDFSGYATITSTDSSVGATILAETVSGHSNQPAIMLAQGQAICFAPPTGANTGVYIVYDGTHLKATINGGSTFTNIV